MGNSIQSTSHSYHDNHGIRHATNSSYNGDNKKRLIRDIVDKIIIFMEAIITTCCSYYQYSNTIIMFLLCSFLSISTSVVYDAPATNEYFRSQFNGSVANVRELSCNESSNAYFGTTSDVHPVEYYHLTITTAMKKKYAGSLAITTCCAPDFCQQDKVCDERILGDGKWKDNWYNQFNLSYNNISYDAYCGDSSLDSILYILRVKKGKIFLVDFVDDSILCQDRKKSYIDLHKYVEGEYIVGVGDTGVSQNNGSYFIQTKCNKYSFPMTEQQFDPFTADNKPLNCGIMLQDQTLTNTNPLEYYKLNSIKTSDVPITISSYSNNSITPYMYLIKSESDSYQLISETESFNDDLTSQIILTDVEFADYYVVAQGYFNEVSTYSISMTCSPTSQPTNSPTFDVETDRVCVTGSELASINGLYKYWNSTVNGIVFYNEATQLHLFPYIDELSRSSGYMIGDDATINIAYCNITKNISNAILNAVDCFDNWKINNGSFFVNGSNMRLVQCNDICVSGNYRSRLDGTYRWKMFSTRFNGSIYFCEECDYFSGAYLYPWVWPDRDYYWHIDNDDYADDYPYDTSTRYSDCFLGNNLNSAPFSSFDKNDCINNWRSWDDGWFTDEMLADRCTTPFPTNAPTYPTNAPTNRVCASSLISTSINGAYKYWNGSVYYNIEKNRYLYYYMNNYTETLYEYYVFIGSVSIYEYAPDEMYCIVHSLTANYIFHPDDCYKKWKYWDESESELIAVNCDDICVSGMYFKELDSVYKWLHFSTTFNGSVYICDNCGNGSFLYPWIVDSDYQWRIGANYTTGLQWNHCHIEKELIHPGYIFSLEDCPYWESIQSTCSSCFKRDEDAIAAKCLTQSPTFDPTKEPTVNPTLQTIPPTLPPTLIPTLSPTLPYSFPIVKSEFTVSDNYQNISCGEILSN
eukprot:332340_1